MPRTRSGARSSRTTSYRGHQPEESTVAVFYVWGSVWSEHLRAHWQEKLTAMMSGLEPLEGALFVLDPIVAREFCAKGLDSQEKIAQWVFDHVRIPARRYWDHIMLNMVREQVEGGVEPWAGLSKAEPDELIPLFQQFGVNVVVAGGETNGHFSIFQGAQMPPAFRSDPNVPLVSPIDPWR